ncbi:hypothetical protein CHS0354_002430 [Potamilus streckersoni]|uniref:Ig-like domain-containing protein n=1 Tax=Potamilus streckersoni TaxID=2493646 RepID=A0AAE0T9T4_9BIVA|nr:hypothetical protein CHS0354_002430 [Potamilus streckersoni]
MAAVYFCIITVFVIWFGYLLDGSYAVNNLCPSACTCLGGHVDCSELGLIEVPKDVPSWTEKLYLQKNGISLIIEDDFKGLTNLELLDLTANEIQYLNESAFRNLPSLKDLKLNNNKLEEIPVFRDNPNLLSLELNHNRIHTIDMQPLTFLTSLESLQITHNDIMHLSKESFPANLTLKKLGLNNNKISYLEAGCFDNLTSLESLKLNKNKIKHIPKELFSKLKNLKQLDVSKNSLEEIEGLSFKGLENLQVLKLRRNFISHLSDGTFWGLEKIQTLQLDYNNITVLSRSWLYGLESLRHLSVSKNRIVTIESSGWEFCPDLVTLDISDNRITTIAVDTFSKLQNLKILQLSNNQITNAEEEAFKNMGSLEELDLNNNRISMTIEDMNGAFVGLVKLKELRLERNRIKTITKQAFMGLRTLEKLFLGNNNITTIQGNPFDEIPGLRELYFNSSSLLCDCQLSWLPMWLRDNNFERSVLAKCSHPESLKGKSIFTVDSNDFKCEGHYPKPVIIKNPQTQMILKGENVTLNCSAASTESQGTPTQFHWKKDNMLIPEGNIENYANRSGNVTHYISKLHIILAQDSDAGRYQCIISNKFGSGYSKRAQISVHVFPVFTKTPEDVTVKQGSTAKLVCAARGQPQPSISWKKDGGDDFPAAKERRMHVIPDDDVFFIVEVKRKDEGIYSCTASNEAGSIVVNASLTVLEPPSFAKPMESKVTRLKDSTMLECFASGSPWPKITWSKDGVPIEITGRYFESAQSQLLIIVQTELSDAGKYMCEMSNTLGTQRGYSTLSVITDSSKGIGDASGSGREGGLDDESTTTGIIIIAVVCCVVGTSLVWVIIIYQTRKRQELYSATPTDETTLPGEVPSSGYNSSDKEGSFSQPVPLKVPGYHYQVDMQMKESGYESSSGRFRAARTAAIFPSDVNGEDPQASYGLLSGENQYPELSDDNSESSILYEGSEIDSIHSGSTSHTSNSQTHTLRTFHPQPTNHDRLTPPAGASEASKGTGQVGALTNDHGDNKVTAQTENSVCESNPASKNASSLCDSVLKSGDCVMCSSCKNSCEQAHTDNGTSSIRHNGPPRIPLKPARSRNGRHRSGLRQAHFDSSQPLGGPPMKPENPGVGSCEESTVPPPPPPLPLVTCPMTVPHHTCNNHHVRSSSTSDCVNPVLSPPVVSASTSGPYLHIYPHHTPVNTHCHMCCGPSLAGLENQRLTQENGATGTGRLTVNGIVGSVHTMLKPPPLPIQWHGHSYHTYPYLQPSMQHLVQQTQNDVQVMNSECGGTEDV